MLLFRRRRRRRHVSIIGDDEFLVLTHQIGNDGLLDLEAAVRLFARQSHLVRCRWRHEDDAIFASLQNIGDDELQQLLAIVYVRISLCICDTYLSIRRISVLQLTRCLYLFKLSRALLISRPSSVSSLNETTNALGTQSRTNGASIFGTSCSEMVGAPWPDCILCVGCTRTKMF